MYRVDGTRILHHGKEIQLHGVNPVGMELDHDAVIGGLWDHTIEHYLDQIKSLGFNFLRLPIGPRVLRNEVPNQKLLGFDYLKENSKLWGKGTLDILDTLIDECEKRGLRYMFDMHYLEDGKILGLWYSERYPEEQWLEDMVTLSDRYAGRPGFVGIDTKNEPNNPCTWGTGDRKTDWRLANERAFEVIDSVNSDIILAIEYTSTSLDAFEANPPNIPSDRFCWSMHIYFNDVWGPHTDVFKAPDFPKNLPALWDKFFGNVGKKRCVFIGEFGGYYGSKDPGDKLAQDAFVSYLTQRGITNTAYWAWGPNSGDSGGVLTDWNNPNPGKVKLLNSLRTANATYTTDVTPAPKPEPTPQPTPQPAPVKRFTLGDLVKFKAGGPTLVVLEYQAEGQVVVGYFNEVRGEFNQVALAEVLLVKI